MNFVSAVGNEVFKRYVAGGSFGNKIAKAAVKLNTDTKRNPKSESPRIRSVSASVVCRGQDRTMAGKFDGDQRTLNGTPAPLLTFGGYLH